MSRNEAAERLRKEYPDKEWQGWLNEALATERRLTVERLRAHVRGLPWYGGTDPVVLRDAVLAILNLSTPDLDEAPEEGQAPE